MDMAKKSQIWPNCHTYGNWAMVVDSSTVTVKKEQGTKNWFGYACVLFTGCIDTEM